MVILVGDLPDDLLQHVLDGHQPGDRPVLVDQQRHVLAVLLHLTQQRIQRLGVRDEHRRPHHLRHGDVAPAIHRVIRLLDKIFEEDHADDVVHVLPNHRNAGMPAAHRQRSRLTSRLVGFDPHHLGARHHHLAGRRIAQLEHRLDHPAFVIGHHTALLRHVDHLAQLDLGGERSVTETASGRHRVAEQNQQPRNRAQQHRNHLQGNGGAQRDRVRVLTSQRARAHPDGHETRHHHDNRGNHQRRTKAHPRGEIADQEHRRQDLAGGAQQHHQVHVTRTLPDHHRKPHRTGPLLADQLVDTRRGHRVDGRIDSRERAAQADERDRRQQQPYARHHSSKLRDLSSRRLSRYSWACCSYQSCSSWFCSANISRSSSGSAWS